LNSTKANTKKAIKKYTIMHIKQKQDRLCVIKRFLFHHAAFANYASDKFLKQMEELIDE